jgi:hypothetical protein
MNTQARMGLAIMVAVLAVAPNVHCGAGALTSASTNATRSLRDVPSMPEGQGADPIFLDGFELPTPIAPWVFTVGLAGLLDGNSLAWEQARDVVRDELGNIYIVGGTTSADFPVTPGAFDTTFATGGTELGAQGPTDAFVTKMDSTGHIIWSTYLGGPNYERAYAVEVDAAHNVYVAGRGGRGFPVTSGALQTVFADDNVGGAYGKQDGFVAKLSADGASLVWASYFGDNGPGILRDMDVDASGRVHVVMNKATGPQMDQYVTPTAPQQSRHGNTDMFYARLSANGASVEFGTYLGGIEVGVLDANPSVRVLGDGTAYVLTSEQGNGAPVTPNAYQPNYRGNADLLVAKFSPAGQMLFCTYLGGSGEEFMDTHSLELDAAGNLVISSGSKSTDYPVTDASVHMSPTKSDIATSVLSSDGSTLLHSTLLGGTLGESPEGIGVDGAGNIYITGSIGSVDLPVTPGALNTTHIAGEREGFMLVYSPTLVPQYVSYDGIPGEYANRSMHVGVDGWNVVGAVWHLSPFPATANQDAIINGTHAAFFRVLTRSQ